MANRIKLINSQNSKNKSNWQAFKKKNNYSLNDSEITKIYTLLSKWQDKKKKQRKKIEKTFHPVNTNTINWL